MYNIRIMDLNTGKLVIDSNVVAAMIGASDGKGAHEIALIEANAIDAAMAILSTEHALEKVKESYPTIKMAYMAAKIADTMKKKGEKG